MSSRALRKILLTASVVAASVLPGLLHVAVAEPPEVLARVGDTAITRSEVLAAAAKALSDVQRQRHEILQQAVNELVDKKLIEDAAAAAGQDARGYLEAQIEPRVSPPTDEQVQAFFNQVKSRLGGRTLEQVRPQIVQKLEDDQRQQAYGDLLAELREKNDVRILIEPYRVEVSADDDPFRGAADAPVTIVEFSDYQCPFCSRAEDVIDRLLEDYGKHLKVVFRDLPLESLHPDAPKVHEAAGCAEEQDRFWAMHAKLFASRSALGRETLIDYATDLELDVGAFTTCLDEGKRTAEVQADIAAAQTHGITGTPAFFINGRLLSGAQPYEAFEEVILDELRRKGVDAETTE
jgi:protein-disulfide isomerase